MPKYIFITGGVLSSLGKGVASAVIAANLQAHGYKVRCRKMDGYLNVDPGTMSPYKHGEVFVTDDGAETDLDLGHYERFTGVSAQRTDSTSAGRIYNNIIQKERRGDYLGSDIQVIPHVTDEIKDFITSNYTDEDFALIEVGGTIGDIEQRPFVESIRQVALDVGRKNAMFIHLSYIPYLKTTGEMKTKPTQASVRELLGQGIQPDMLLCRCDQHMDDSMRKKIAMFCNVSERSVISAITLPSIYDLPLLYRKQGVDREILNYFNAPYKESPDFTKWEEISENLTSFKNEITVGIAGKYQLKDAYKSLYQSLLHAGLKNHTKVNIRLIDTEQLEKGKLGKDIFDGLSGIVVPGGFGFRGAEGKIRTATYARENNIPYLGICFGMQMAVIEACRNLLGIKDASSSEFEKGGTSVIGLMTEWEKEGEVEKRSVDGNMGGTLRLGNYPCYLTENTFTRKIYNVENIEERHRHRYEMNIAYEAALKEKGILISGKSPDGTLPEIIENINHPWFVGVQFHPELKSKPFAPHPLFVSFVKAATML
ncbi:MAG: CTP synthase [Alphaproteobacteria bacterium]|nr:CTP synthase [Alphaproteobacteria bacterium]